MLIIRDLQYVKCLRNDSMLYINILIDYIYGYVKIIHTYWPLKYTTYVRIYPQFSNKITFLLLKVGALSAACCLDRENADYQIGDFAIYSIVVTATDNGQPAQLSSDLRVIVNFHTFLIC